MNYFIILLVIFPVLAFPNVFGRDERIEITTRNYPFSAIGKLGGCTGTLVKNNLVLTAAHCVYSNGKWIIPDEFRANIVRGEALATAKIKKLHTIGENWVEAKDRNSDWALVELETPLGERVGTLSVSARGKDNYLGLTVNAAGYSGDLFQKTKSAYIDNDCKIIKERSEFRDMVDCDFTHGASGGTVYRMDDEIPEIIGIISTGASHGGIQFYPDGYERIYSNNIVNAEAFAKALNN